MPTSTAPTGFGRPIWNAIKGGNQVHGVGLTPVTVRVQGANANFSRAVFMAPASATGGFWKVESAKIISDTTISAEGSNYWKFSLKVAGDFMGDELATTSVLTLNTAYDLDVKGPESTTPKNVFLAAGDLLYLNGDKVTGSSVDTSGIDFGIQVLLRHSPPGR